MARTEAGATLTQAHRQGQLRIRARALQDFAVLWPIWTGDETTFRRLLDATLPLIRSYHTLSGSLAAGYYETFRSAERVRGPAAPRVAPPLNEDEVRGTLHLVGAQAARRAIGAGRSPEAAMRTALVRTSGSLTRFTLAGGRDALLLSSAEDKEARGWSRVTGGRACAFCAMLASRGASYLSETTAEFQAHDHCSCTAEVQYEGSAPPPENEHWAQLWDEAQREARETGELASSTAANPALDVFRRYLSRL